MYTYIIYVCGCMCACKSRDDASCFKSRTTAPRLELLALETTSHSKYDNSKENQSLPPNSIKSWRLCQVPLIVSVSKITPRCTYANPIFFFFWGTLWNPIGTKRFPRLQNVLHFKMQKHLKMLGLYLELLASRVVLFRVKGCDQPLNASCIIYAT